MESYLEKPREESGETRKVSFPFWHSMGVFSPEPKFSSSLALKL
jgi:hypothetical protein